MSGTTSYVVGSRLDMGGNAAAVLRLLGREIAALDKRIDGTQAKLNHLTGSFARMAQVSHLSAQATARALGSLSAAAQGVHQATAATNRALQTQASRLAANASAATQLAGASTSAARAMRALASVPPPPPIPRGGAYGAHGGGGAGVAGGVGRRRITDPSPWEALYAGRALGSAAWSVMEAGGAEQTQATMLRARGIPPREREAVEAAAPRIANSVPGTTTVDAFKAITEAMNAIGDIGKAIEIAPALLRAGSLSAQQTGQTLDDALRPFTRFLANRGSFTNKAGETDVAQALRDLKALEAATIGYGEGVLPREWENLSKQAGPALRQMSIEGAVGALGSRIQEVGGQKTGTELQAFYDQVVSGVMQKGKAAEWQRIGLLSKDARLQKLSPAEIDRLVALRRAGKDGGISEEEADDLRQQGGARVTGAGVQRRDLARERPDLWFRHVLIPLLVKAGYKTEDEQLDWWEKNANRQTGRRFGGAQMQVREVANDIRTVQRVEEQQRLAAQGQATDPTDIMLRESFKGAANEVGASFNSLLSAVGRSDEVVRLLNDVAAGFRDMGTAARDNPDFMKNVAGELRQFVADVRDVAGPLREALGGIADVFRSVSGVFVGSWDLFRNTGREVGAIKDALGLFRGGGAAGEALDAGGAAGPRGFGRRGALGGFYGPEGEAGSTRLRGFMAPLGGRTGGSMEDGAPGETPLRLNPNLRLGSFDPVPPRGDVVINTALNVDGQRLATAVTRHQVNAASGPPLSAGRPDMRRNFVPAEGAVG